jgi:hypothetical protein
MAGNGAYRRGVCALFVIFLSSVISREAIACPWFRAPYRERILPKITGGIPLELVGLVTRGDELLDKKFVRVQYDLWDETVTLSAGSNAGKPIPLKAAEQAICTLFGGAEGSVEAGAGSTLRMYLNPVFEGRLQRIAEKMASETNASALSLLEVNWRRLMRNNGNQTLILKRDL